MRHKNGGMLHCNMTAPEALQPMADGQWTSGMKAPPGKVGVTTRHDPAEQGVAWTPIHLQEVRSQA